MNVRTVGVLLGLIVAASASAQDGVVLNGWVLPEETEVVLVGGITFEQQWTMAWEDGTLGFLDLRESDLDSTRLRIEVIEDGHLTRATRHYVRSRRSTEVESTAGWDAVAVDVPSPMEGQRLRFARDGDNWLRTLLDVTPTDEQRDFIEGFLVPEEVIQPIYPWAPVEVGQAWTVGHEVLGRLYPDLADDAPQRLTMRLDSTGTHEGHPAAFLTFDLETTRALPEEGRSTRYEQGHVVRLLDLFVNAAYVSEGTARLAGSMTMGDGRRAETEAVTTFTIAYTQSVVLP